MAAFEGEIKAKGVNGTLMSEAGKEGGKGPQISARFIMEKGQKGKDNRGKPVEVGGVELVGYLTITEKTRERCIQSLVNFGIRRPVAKQFVENTEAGEYGKMPEKAGFGSKIGSLTISINDRNGKSKIEWWNGPEGGRQSKANNAPVMELDLNAPDEDGDGTDDDVPY